MCPLASTTTRLVEIVSAAERVPHPHTGEALPFVQRSFDMCLEPDLRPGVDCARGQPLVGPAYIEDATASDAIALGHVRRRTDDPDRVHRMPRPRARRPSRGRMKLPPLVRTGSPMA